jgi:trans-2,3-dihydro-3-hydroxyanthranilate isomerase
MTGLRYEIVDVFTDRPFTGNPLAVVFGADELATSQLQALAKEFNLSETVFVLPPTGEGAAQDATYRARIFTPARELPFAGHPSVGAAGTQYRLGQVKAGTVRQECGAGVLPIVIEDSGRVTLTGGDPTVGPESDPAPVLESVGLPRSAFAGTAPRVAGCGFEFEYLHVRREALADATPPRDGNLSVFAWDAATHTAYVRVFAPGAGVPEDPATGAAALGLGVFLVAASLLPADGTTSYTVRQGHEMGRPSLLECTVTAAKGVAQQATVAGHVVAIASGEITVPPFVG